MSLSPGHRGLLAAAVLTVVVGCFALQREVLDGVAHGWDALAYAYQAQVFASGRVAAPVTEFEPFFHFPTIVEAHARRFAIYPPGWPLALSVFVLLGIRNLASPVVAGVCAFLIWRLARRLCGLREAWIALGLAVLSPFYMFMGTSGIAHLPCATAILALQLGLLRALETAGTGPGLAWGLLAGGAAAAAFLTRPYSAALGVAASLWLAAWTCPASPRAWARVMLAAAPTAATGVVLLLVYNRLTTGSALVTGYHLFSPNFSFLGARAPVRSSIWANFVANTPNFLHTFDREIWGGFLPDLWLLPAVMLLRPRRPSTWGLVGAALLFLCGQSCYYYFDLYFGPRMGFEALPWILVASASGIVALFEFAWSRLHASLRLLVCGVTLANSAWGAATLYPMLIEYYGANYCGQGGAVARAVEAKHLADAIVFVKSVGDFAFYDLMDRNAVDPRRSRVVFARFIPGRAADLLAALPRQEAWVLVVDYRSLPGRNIYGDRFEITRLAWYQ